MRIVTKVLDTYVTRLLNGCLAGLKTGRRNTGYIKPRLKPSGAENGMDFQKQVIGRSREIPVLVDFWAPWCGPCRTLGPILDTVAQELAGRLELVKLNTEEQPELASRYGIRSIPHCKLFVDGEVRAEFSGALPRSAVMDWLRQHLPSQHADSLEQAGEKLLAGDTAAVAMLLEPVLENEPDNAQALLLLAKARLSSSPAEAERLLGAIPVNADNAQQAEHLKFLARELSEATLQDESDAAVAYRKALQHVRQGQLADAEQALLASLQADRHAGQDAARKALLGLMAYYSDDAARLAEMRQRMSAVLFR